MKINLWTLVAVCLLVTLNAEAQIINFGVTNTTYLGHQAVMVVGGQQGLSHSLQVSSDGVSFAKADSNWVPGGQLMFVNTGSFQPGYFRVTTSSNSVVYVSTNTATNFLVTASVVAGNRSVTVIGPSNLTGYTVWSGSSITNLAPAFFGIAGQTNFLDPGVVNRFYQVRFP